MSAGRALAEALVKLAESIGATVWYEGIRGQASFPTSHANARAGLPPDAEGIRKSLEGADLVLLVGGPFFEDVWYAPGSPIPAGAKVVQIETTGDRLAYNFPLTIGLAGDLPATIGAVVTALEAAASADDRSAATQAQRGACAGQDARCGSTKSRGCKRPGTARRHRWRAPWPRSAPARPKTPSSSTRASRPRSISPARSISTHRARSSQGAAAASARVSPAPSACRWRCPASRCCASPATARRCTRSRRCGARRITTCRSCSSSWPTANTAFSSTTSTPTARASTRAPTSPTRRWTWAARSSASSISPGAWASPARS